MNRLLDLIEEGESDLILSDEELLKKLNELLKYELVVICSETIILTDKGKEAKQIGIDKVLKREKSKQIQKDYINQNITISYPPGKKKFLFAGLVLLPFLFSLLYLLF